MNQRSLTPSDDKSDDKIARRNYVLLCTASTLLLGLVVLFAVLYLG